MRLRATKKFSTLEVPIQPSSSEKLEMLIRDMDITKEIAGESESKQEHIGKLQQTRATYDIAKDTKATARKFSTLSLNAPTGSPTEEPPNKRVRQEFKRKKSYPNFFIGIRLNCSVFRALVKDIQNEIKYVSPHLANCMTSDRKLHLTCFVLHLSSDEEIERAVSCLHDCEDAIRTIMHDDTTPRLAFDSLGQFKSNVLFASPVSDTCLARLRDVTRMLADTFFDRGLLDSQSRQKTYTWQPHVTLAKTSEDKSRKGRNVKILPCDYENCISAEVLNAEEPVVVNLSSLDLLSMAGIEEDGYYVSYASLSLALTR